MEKQTKGLSLRVGGVYRNRQGDIRTIVRCDLSYSEYYPFVDHKDAAYMPSGGYSQFYVSEFDLIEEINVQQQKEFDWDAFNNELQKSANICPEAREDIKRAIAVGKGEKVQPKLAAGQVYQYRNDPNLRLIVDYYGALRSVCLSGQHGAYDVDSCIKGGSYTFIAHSLKEYLDNGGKL